ncbi:MAG: hypothetical protein IJT00_03100 [Lachnospiraceae bacterium]|nr:hypothetical protein [Lachnospiraceae bacterium]
MDNTENIAGDVAENKNPDTADSAEAVSGTSETVSEISENDNKDVGSGAPGPVSVRVAGRRPKWLIPAVLACAAFILITLRVYGYYHEPQTKVIRAVRKTAAENDLVTALNPYDLISGGSYRANLTFSASSTGVSFGADYSQNAKLRQQSFTGTANIALARVEVEEYYDSDGVLLAMPGVVGNTYRYDYENGSLGDAAKVFRLEGDRERAVSDLLTVISGTKWSSGGKIGKWFRRLDLVRGENREFEVDGRPRDCEAYSVTVGPEDLQRLRYDLAAGNREDGSRIEEDLKVLGFPDVVHRIGKRLGTEEVFTEGTYTFYLWKGKLAAVTAEHSLSRMEICFRGGDFRSQNMVIDRDGTVYELKGTRNGGTDNAELLKGEERIASLSFDRTAGSLNMDLKGHVVNLIVSRDREKWKLSTSDPILVKGAPLTGSLTFEAGPDIIRPSQGDTVDISGFDEEAVAGMKAELRRMFEEGGGE